MKIKLNRESRLFEERFMYDPKYLDPLPDYILDADEEFHKKFIEIVSPIRHLVRGSLREDLKKFGFMIVVEASFSLSEEDMAKVDEAMGKADALARGLGRLRKSREETPYGYEWMYILGFGRIS